MSNLFTWVEIFQLSIAWLVVSVLNQLLNNWTIGFTKSMIYWLLFRFMIAWFAVIIAFYVYAHQIVTLLFPYWAWTIGLIQNDYTAELLIPRSDMTMVDLVATLTHDIKPLVKGDSMQVYAKAFHLILPLALMLTILSAWPVKHFRHRVIQLLCGIPGCFLLTGLTAPFQLCGAIEIALQEISKNSNIFREKPYLLNWAHILENGGNWLRVFALVVVGNIVLNQKRWFGGSDLEEKSSNKLI